MSSQRLLSPILLAIAALCGTRAMSAECSHHLLVSGYFSNNVVVFDACTGTKVRDLDDSGRISGAQAVRLGSDGRLYVVSEGNNRILRYDASTYAFVDTFAQLDTNTDPTGLDFGPDDHVYVASYSRNSVLRLDDQTGALLDLALPVGSGLNGADNGMGFGPDGLLYVPGYDSDSVLRMNVLTNEIQPSFVPARSGGLNAARNILFEPGGQTFLVTGELSGAVYRYRLSDGSLVERLISGLQRPTGMALAPDGSLLVLAQPNERVYRFDRQSGAALGSLLDAKDSGIEGGTFLTLLPNPTQAVDASQIGTQYWVSGPGLASGKTVALDMYSATGTEFGEAFDPDDVVRKRWGSIRFEFLDCDHARFSYASTGADTANFGSSGYDMVRILNSNAAIACRASAFDQVSDFGWMSGTWFNAARSGEGVFLEVDEDGLAVGAYFTHLPDGF